MYTIPLSWCNVFPNIFKHLRFLIWMDNGAIRISCIIIAIINNTFVHVIQLVPDIPPIHTGHPFYAQAHPLSVMRALRVSPMYEVSKIFLSLQSSDIIINKKNMDWRIMTNFRKCWFLVHIVWKIGSKASYPFVCLIVYVCFTWLPRKLGCVLVSKQQGDQQL